MLHHQVVRGCGQNRLVRSVFGDGRRLRRAVTLRWRRANNRSIKKRQIYQYKLEIFLFCAMAQNARKQRSEWVNTIFQERQKKVSFSIFKQQRWNPRGRPWPQGRPREHILKFLALASKPQVLENCPVLGSRTALFFEQLKFCWKTPEISRKICEHLFCFPHLEHRRRQREGGRGPPQMKFHQ